MLTVAMSSIGMYGGTLLGVARASKHILSLQNSELLRLVLRKPDTPTAARQRVNQYGDPILDEQDTPSS